MSQPTTTEEWAEFAASGGQAFLEAAKKGNIHEMEPLLAANPLLLSYGGKGCSLGFIGHTALHWAAAKDNTTLCKWLLSKGAPLHATNNAESTPLHTCAQNGSAKVAELLLNASANVNLENADKQTPLAVALERGHQGVVSLLQRGAVLGSLLAEMASRDDESSWKVAEMKKALTLGGVDIDGVADKLELVSLLRELIAKQPPPPTAPSTTSDSAASSSAAPQDVSEARADEGSPSKSSPAASAAAAASGAAGFFSAAGADKVKAKKKAAAAPAPELSSDDDEDDAKANEAGAERCKTNGNKCFSSGDFNGATKQFTMAIRMTPKNHVLYSNRSAAYASLGKGTEALSDAEKCVELMPTWAKGYSRLGAAHILVGRYKEAMKAYRAGLEIEPENAGLLKGLEDLKVSLRKGEAPETQQQQAGAGGGGAGGGGGGGASSSTAASAAPPKPKPKPAPAAAPSNLPIGQQWIEAAKKGDRATMEELRSRSGGDELVHYKARGIGHTAMHWAASTGDRQLMQWLLSLGADVNARNSSDATPLHTAAGAAQFMSVEWLLENGADPTLQNDDDLTPSAVAMKKGRKDIATEIDKGSRAPKVAAAAGATEEPPLNNLPAGMEQVLEREEVRRTRGIGTKRRRSAHWLLLKSGPCRL